MSKQDSFKGVPIVWDEVSEQEANWWHKLPDYQPHRTKSHTLLLNSLRKPGGDASE